MSRQVKHAITLPASSNRYACTRSPHTKPNILSLKAYAAMFARYAELFLPPNSMLAFTCKMLISQVPVQSENHTKHGPSSHHDILDVKTANFHLLPSTSCSIISAILTFPLHFLCPSLPAMVLLIKKKEKMDVDKAADSRAPGAASASTAEAGGPTKKSRPGDAEEVKKERPRNMDKTTSALHKSMLKAILRCFQDGRDVQGILFDTALGEASLDELIAGQEQSTAYNDLTHGVSNHGQGPPHLFVAGGTIASLLEQITERLKTDKANEAQLKVWAGQLKTLADKMEAATTEEKARMIRFFKISKAYKKRGETQKLRVTMSWGPDPHSQEARLLMMQVMKDFSRMEWKVGRPPAGGLERDIQAWLEVFV